MVSIRVGLEICSLVVHCVWVFATSNQFVDVLRLRFLVILGVVGEHALNLRIDQAHVLHVRLGHCMHESFCRGGFRAEAML